MKSLYVYIEFKLSWKAAKELRGKSDMFSKGFAQTVPPWDLQREFGWGGKYTILIVPMSYLHLVTAAASSKFKKICFK